MLKCKNFLSALFAAEPGEGERIGIILGPTAGDNLNRALLVSGNDWSIVGQRPISLGFLILAVISAAVPLHAACRERQGSAPEVKTL